MDIERVATIIDEIALAGQPIPVRLQRPGGNAVGDPRAWKSYREAMSDLGSDIDWAFTERDLFLEWTSPARPKARYDYLVRLRAAAEELASLLKDAPPGASLNSYFPPFNADAPEGTPALGQMQVGAAYLVTAAKAAARLIEGANDGKTALLASQPGEGKGWVTEHGWPVRSGAEAFYSRMTKTYREHLAEAGDWQPDLKLSTKTGSADPFTTFIIASHAARDEVVKAESVQGEYRRWRRTWTTDKPQN